jgi:hypothetical protein
MFIADVLSTGSLFSLTLLELITGVVFIVGFMMSFWKLYDAFRKELHNSLASYGETVQTSLISFETKVVNQIREEIKMSIAILENRQELRIAIAEDKIHTHNDEIKSLRDVSYKVKLMEADLAGIKERVAALEKSY